MRLIYNENSYFHYGSSHIGCVDRHHPAAAAAHRAARRHGGVRPLGRSRAAAARPDIYFVIEGRCWFQADERRPDRTRAGRLRAVGQAAADAFLSEPGAETVLSDEAFKASHSVDGELRIGDPARRNPPRGSSAA